MDLLKKAEELLNAFPLCDSCLGRQFALLGYGLSDQKRGETLKLLLTMKKFWRLWILLNTQLKNNLEKKLS